MVIAYKDPLPLEQNVLYPVPLALQMYGPGFYHSSLDCLQQRLPFMELHEDEKPIKLLQQNEEPGEILSVDEDDAPMDLSMKKEDLEWRELEQFVQRLKRHRLRVGMTQGDVGVAVGRAVDCDFSQTTISRFEAMNLSYKNMCKLRPLLQQWLDEQNGVVRPASSSGSACSSPGLASIRRRKKRTTFDTNVRQALERCFSCNSKPTAEEISSIADTLQTDKEVVRVWFCNRRQKEKRSLMVPRHSHKY